MNPVTKFVVGSTFPIHPPRGGGQLRIFHLYGQLARHIPVDVVALVEGDQAATTRELAPGLTEIRVPKSAAHAAEERGLHVHAGIPIADIAFTLLHELTPAFSDAVAASATDGCVLVASHPYAFPAMSAAAPGQQCWYDAHNVEADLKAAMLSRWRRIGRRLLRRTREVERECCRRASLVLTVSAQDGRRLRHLYRVPDDRCRVVPNGVDASSIHFRAPAERRRLSERLRMCEPLALFIGSWHEPNLRAARQILDLARRVPEVRFGIAGSVGIPLDGKELPANVELFGVVSDELKQALLAVASLALNPVQHGSGTNMKMLDYMAAGVPVISTAVGARGLALDESSPIWIARPDQFDTAIRALLEEPLQAAAIRVRAARRHVEAHFDWAVVARGLLEAIGTPAADQARASSVASTA
jgi:glycosyltransferase involved in cell wall biosynthesis